jgi:AraC-like DNA-binding protein
MHDAEGNCNNVPTTALPVQAEWLLQEGDDERSVQAGERIFVEDDHWRFESERIDVDTGMCVFLHSADVYRPVTLTPRQSDVDVWLAANIAIKGEVGLATSDGLGTTIDEKRSVLFRPADRTARYTPTPGRTLKLAGYMLHAERITRIFGGEVPKLILPLLERSLDSSVILSSPVSARLKRLASSLFTQHLNGPLRSIFMEGVVLQLFALQAGYAMGLRERTDSLSPQDRKAIESARSRLLSDMRKPPTLGELAAEAGMSEKALNAGFRALYGSTVFETLRDERLEHALITLRTEAVPIKTIAFRVGYNHVTNFITAFTRRFGTPPRQYLLQSEDSDRHAPYAKESVGDAPHRLARHVRT